jgi:hypothetical protein
VRLRRAALSPHRPTTGPHVRARSVTLIAAVFVLAGSFALPHHASAQGLREQCTGVIDDSSLPYCRSLADAAVTLPARLAIAAAGGNPVFGTASTLGMRVPGSPRWSIALRSSVAPASLPPIGGEQPLSPAPWSVNADVSVGLFNGFNLLPTIGGFGSIDVLGSIGVLSLPDDDFERSSPMTWALGTRVGILRESFTAPGVSVSAMYRSLADIEHGDSEFGPYFENTAQSVLSLRGTVGKRVLGLGLTAGVGYDRTTSDVRAYFNEGFPEFPVFAELEENDVSFNRTSFFGNVSYTLLILNMAAEIGWQESGDRAPDAHEDTGKGGLFGGIAVRLAI